MRDEDFHKDDDWDEEDWERFLQKADVRNAKYMELFETLHNHPDCDDLIAKEMDGIMNTKIVMMRINRVMIVRKMMRAIYTK